MNEELKEIFTHMCNRCNEFAKECTDIIIKNNLQNEQFALDFADKLNFESGRI